MATRWIVTTKTSVELASLAKALAEWGCEVPDDPPVPLGDGEQSISILGPLDLPRKLESDPRFIAIYPDSDMSFD